MEEEATTKEMPKDLNSTPLEIISGQELPSEIAEESASKSSMDESQQETSPEHSIRSSEIITIVKSLEMRTSDEVGNLGCSSEDNCANVGVNFPVKDIVPKDSTKRHTSEECEGKEFVDCDIESIKKVTLQVPEPEKNSVDTIKETSESYQLNLDGTSNSGLLSTDNVCGRIDMSIREIEKNSHQVFEQCMDDLVKKVIDDLDHEIQNLTTASGSRRGSGKKILMPKQNKMLLALLKGASDQTVPSKIISESPSDLQGKLDEANMVQKSDQKLKMSDDSASEKRKLLQLKEILKDIDILLSCIEEIGRMNEIFKNEVVKMLSEIKLIRKSSRYVDENLSVLEEIPECTAVFLDAEKNPFIKVNVYDYGVDLLHDLSRLFLSFKELLTDLNNFRLKFIDLSETFSSNPFELHAGESQSVVLYRTFSAAFKIYKEFFDNDHYEILHAQYVSEHEELQKVGIEFDIYLNKLDEQYGINLSTN